MTRERLELAGLRQTVPLMRYPVVDIARNNFLKLVGASNGILILVTALRAGNTVACLTTSGPLARHQL